MENQAQHGPASGPVLPLRGMATVSFWSEDLPAAVAWYTRALGCPPYFERPGYAEFRVGDLQQELGVIDRRYAPSGAAGSPGGAILYWHVDDPDTVVAALRALGATEHQPLTDRGGGFRTASVLDPFGNILGLMRNPHYLDALPSRTAP
ncbi:VOC family protein [Streptomyces sp. NPDC007088]|uniref:VOC family protein n=1 Tax=Streptomyces sp. NPDC007088 TaxID=3364773 RepID=UPI0036905FC8